jgi:SLT domain-containing protein
LHWCEHRVKVQRSSENVANQNQENSAKFPEKNPGSFSIKPCKIQQESRKISGKKNQEDLIQSQTKFNRILEKVAEKVPENIIGAFGAKPKKIQ